MARQWSKAMRFAWGTGKRVQPAGLLATLGGRDEHLRFTGGGSEGQREGARSRSHCGSEGLAFRSPVSTRHWPWAAPGTEWQNPPTGWQPPLAEGHVSGDCKSRAPLAAARSSGVGARGEGGVAGVPAIPALPAVCWALFALAELAYSTESSRQVPNVPDLRPRPSLPSTL